MCFTVVVSAPVVPVCVRKEIILIYKNVLNLKKRKENKSLKTEMLNAKEIKHGLPHCNTLGGLSHYSRPHSVRESGVAEKNSTPPIHLSAGSVFRVQRCRPLRVPKKGKKKQLAVAKNLKRNQLGRNATHHHVAVANHVS